MYASEQTPKVLLSAERTLGLHEMSKPRVHLSLAFHASSTMPAVRPLR